MRLQGRLMKKRRVAVQSHVDDQPNLFQSVVGYVGAALYGLSGACWRSWFPTRWRSACSR